MLWEQANLKYRHVIIENCAFRCDDVSLVSITLLPMIYFDEGYV